jgi:hypothetical protein
VVTDDGTPALGAKQQFSVLVLHPAAPIFSGFSRTDGVFTAVLAGCGGPDYTVQVSTNLIDWATLLETNPPALPFTFIDTNANVVHQRFYRARLRP